MIFLAECARNSCYVNRWSSERRGQTDAKPRAISSSGAASAEAKPTTNREQYQACLNIAEVRRRKTKSAVWIMPSRDRARRSQVAKHKNTP